MGMAPVTELCVELCPKLTYKKIYSSIALPLPSQIINTIYLSIAHISGSIEKFRGVNNKSQNTIISTSKVQCGSVFSCFCIGTIQYLHVFSFERFGLMN